MALTINNGGVLEVVAWGQWHNAVQTRSVMQLRLETGGPLVQAEILEDIFDFLDALLTIVKAAQTIHHIWKGYSVSDLNGADNTGFIPFMSEYVGEITGDPGAPGVAMLQYMRTGVKGRQLRKYWPGVAEASLNSNGNIDTAVTAVVASAAPLFLVNQAFDNGTWAFGHARPGVGASWVRPSGVVVSGNPSYQRRRRRGRGI